VNLKEVVFNKKVAGEVGKNIGLGIFINALYGISDGSIETFNIIDILMGFILMLAGIITERS